MKNKVSLYRKEIFSSDVERDPFFKVPSVSVTVLFVIFSIIYIYLIL